MSPTSRLKRVLVTLLLHFARIYAITVDVSRDSPDTDVKKAFRKVILKDSKMAGDVTLENPLRRDES